MKKQLGFSIVLLFAISALAACGGSSPNESPGGGTSTPPTSQFDAGGGGGGGAVVDAGGGQGSTTTDAGSVPSCSLAGGGQTGSKTCLMLLVGAQSCTSLPTTSEQCTCLQNKFKEGTQEAQGYALAIYNCAINSGCGTNLQCVLQQCSTEWAACRAH